MKLKKKSDDYESWQTDDTRYLRLGDELSYRWYEVIFIIREDNFSMLLEKMRKEAIKERADENN